MVDHRRTNKNRVLKNLLKELRQAGVHLWVEHGKLRSKAPKGAITPALRTQIRFHKDALISFLQQAEQSDESFHIVPAPRPSKIPLSFAQQRLWFLDQMGSSSAYNMPLALTLSGPLNVPALQQTLQEIVRRHESLRTTFELHEGVPYQVIHADMTIDLPVIELSAYAPDYQKAEAQRLMSVEATRPFDLSRDPMLRASLLCLSTPTSKMADGFAEHILLLTMHHIASDGWSMGVLVREMAALYEAFNQGKPSLLPKLPIQYADFAVWQRDYLQGEVLEKQLSYWTERLVDAPELLQLPTDRARPAQQSFLGDVVSVEFDAKLTEGLRTLSQQEGTTLYMTLLAAFEVLISRYSGQTDIVIGSPIANRNQREIEPLIGFFVNTLALRADLSGAPSFLAHLEQVQESVQAAYDHQDIPFERLVEQLRSERNLNHNPLVQVMFALQNAPMGAFELSGLNVTPTGAELQSTRFDLEMHLWEVHDYLQGYCIYSTDLFDKSTIERMMAHFQTLLAGIVKEPTQPIRELPLLTDAERHQLLVEWNDTATDYPADRCIHELFEEQSKRTPDAIALVFAPSRHDKDQKLTYRQLNERANQLAHYLIRQGVGAETLVGITVERSLEMVVGLLAILKAGGAYVPLDPTYPQERLAFMLVDSQIELLLTQQKWLANLPPGFTTLCLDTLELQDTPYNPMPSQNLTAHNLAYVMYTSGSTGRPKGVSVIHQNVVRLVKESNFIECSTDDVFLQLAPISFDAATLEIWGPLLNGGKLVIMPPANPSLDQLGEAIQRYNVSTLWLSAGLFHLMVDYQLDALRSLRWLLAGGDVLSVRHVHRAVQALPNCQLINGYGPTENTTFTCCYPIKEVSASLRSIPIGRPIANTQVYILDNQLQPLPIGVFGELYAGGDGVARGYHNNEELTQERFIANPFAAQKGLQSRLYRTGDVARWLPSGEIEFLGRMDTQVKLRGFRIELGEIETVLTDHANIQDAVVVAREDPLGDKQLVSYLVAGQIDSETQSEHVEQWQNLYEETYGQTPSQENEDLAFNLKGWNSSYTGQSIPEIEMTEWVSGTIADIRRWQPKRVLEIGCGTGLLLSRLAPDCEVYWGTDYSQQAIEHVERLKAATPSLRHVVLSQRMADDFSGIERNQFDCVILNSIVQYFPSVEYLLSVLEGAVRAVCPGGKIYVGDVRNLRLLSAYHAAVQSYQAADDLPLAELQTRIQQRLRDEEELLIDPDFFHALPKLLPQTCPDFGLITQVEIAVKRGEYVNELTQFRYQVVLHVEKADREQVDRRQIEWLEEDWQQDSVTVSTLESLLHQLTLSKPSCGVVIRNIPNGRVQDAMQTLEILEQPSSKQIESVGQLRAQLARQNDHVHPESLWALSETHPYTVYVTWSRSAALMDAFFVPSAHTAMPHLLPLPASQLEKIPKAWRDYTNNPLLGKLNRTLVPNVRRWLGDKLPDYMIPSLFVMLDALPLTPNGKVDRKALPAPLALVRINEDTFVPPSTRTQIALANIWSEVLGIEAISIWDDFFQLGGHSLMATQVVSRIKSHFQINMQVRSVFEHPTIAELGEHINILAKEQEDKQEQSDESFHILPAERTSKIPLSFAQQRLWFLDQMGSSSAYNMPLALKLSGSLNVAALQQTLQEIVRRHESLRTTFELHEGVPYQVIHADMRIDLPVIELSASAPDYQKAEAQRLMSVEATRPFDLSRDPMLRASLLRLSTPTSPPPQGMSRGTRDQGGLRGGAEHILLLTMHHIASDGWSMGVLVREMTALYEAFNEKKPSPLPELPIQYADFAIWQRGYLQGEVLKKQLSYWTEQLADAPELLQLPTDRARPTQQSFQGGVVSLQLDASLTRQVQMLCQQQGTTLYMTLLAAFQVLMSRYSGQTDIVIGSPIANRNRREIEPLIGFFVNTLALRADLSAHQSAPESEHTASEATRQSPSFLALLAQVRETVQAAYDHQDIPFERLVEELKLNRTLSHNPLVQVMFALQNAPMGAFELSGLNVTPTGSSVQSTRSDLEMHVWEVDDYLQGYCIYNSDLFDKTTIERMAGHFQTLLQGMVENPAQSIAELPLLTEREQHQLLVEWNDTATDYPADKCIHQLFEQQVARTPDAIALVFQDEQLTYRTLNERANELAHYLIAQGVGPDVLVAICVPRSVEMVVGLLGILKAGGAYVPLDPNYPKERLQFMLEDANVKVLLTHSKLVETMPDVVPLLDLNQEWTLIGSECALNPITKVRSDHLAYCIYTSGSTGKPKGTLIVHRALTNYLTWCIQTYPVASGCGSPVNSSIGFDATITSLFSPLLVGKQVILLPEEEEIGALANVLGSDEQLSLVKITPAHLEILNQLWPTNNQHAYQCQAFIVGGEALLKKHVAFLQHHVPPIRVINEYGPTETVVGCCIYEVPQASVLPNAIPIGRPIANTQLYILDRHLQPVPIGVPCELHIGGAGVARGYLNRRQLTASKFIPNPFGEGRLYKTGDLCRYLPDGNIEYLGRIDHQVKIRGFRIELGEIEATLNSQPNVREAVVVVREGVFGKQLVAYVTFDDDVVGEVKGLRGAVSQILPDYMIPNAFVKLEAMPLTPNGKIDRRALPAPDMSALLSEDTFVPPTTPTQIALANIWSEVLGIFEVGIHNNFFELGGHSLLATQVVSRIRQTFALEFPLRTLFESPTVARLATSIDDRNRTTQPQPRPAIPLADRSSPLPLSHAQERLWFLDQLGGERNAYNMPSALRLSGALDVDALERTLQELVRRHESLRTTFVMGTGAINTGQPIQIIHPATFTLPVIELGTLSPAEQEAELNHLLMAEVNHAFDLSKGPLFRVTLLRLAQLDEPSTSAEHILLINMHHIISDGWSMQIVGRELGALYSAFTQLRPASLPELSIQYADFAAWQRAWLAEETMAAQLDYWHTQLHNAPPLLMLPTDHPRPPVQSYKGTHHFFSLSAELSQRLQALSLASGTTLFMTMLAAFKILLMRYSGQEDIVVGSPIANRNLLEIEPLIGFFVNTLVLRSDLSGNPTFKELLAQLKSTTLSAYRHQDVPFEKVVEHLQPERHLSHSPLFQVMFDVLPSSFFTIDLPGLTVESVASEYPIAKFDLTLSIVQEAIPEDKESLVGLIEYNTDLFLEATIERMAGHFQTLLQGIVDHPAQPIAQLPLLTEREQHQLLVEWNECAASAAHKRAGPTVRGTATDYPKECEASPWDKCIHQLFEQQVERTPDAIAVVFAPTGHDKDTQLTYHVLNERANQLAHYLIAQGVGPDVLVGICIQRSVEMVVGLLGILKAGGAYVPLDPTLPAERLRYMLSDSGVELLLTESKLAETWPSVVRTLNLDQEWAMWGADSPPITRHAGVANVKTNVKANHLAYCIYTSGSTGKPKGVLVEHKSLVCRSTALKEAYSLSSRDRVLQFAGISFDVMAEELFPAWLSGATVVLCPPSLTDWQSWELMLSDMKLTILNLPAPYWHEWVLELTTLPPDLRLVVVGSDKVLPSRLAKWQEQVNTSTVPERVCGGSVHRVEFLHAYGITEDTITTTLYKPSHDSRRMNSVPIGRPLPNTQLYILDRYQNPVSIGVPGELHIGGAGLARGYLNRPQLTKEKFIPNPFGRRTQACGGRLYKTGDLCRYLPDGNIEFLGRTDYQVKIRGFRIELGEIEAHLQQCVGVSEAVVVVIDSVTGKRLVAYIIIEDGIVIEDDVVAKMKDLRAQLTHSLPNYMIPSAFVRLDALPLTANGKVDRQALVVRSAGGTSEWRGQADFVGPRTATEAELADIWQQLLALSRVSIHDNFFTVGGDSILSLQLVSRCRARGIQITPQQIFEHQTIAELAAAVQSQFAPSTNGALDEAPWTLDAQALVTGEVPLTPIQHGWAALNLPNPHIYNQSILIEIDSRVDSALLRRALQILLRHHDALRLRYQETKAGWRQSFSPPTDEVLLWEVDLTELSESAVRERVVLITSRIERSLNLTKGPMMGLALLRHADGPSQLFWMTHHLVVDWVSWRILLADLETIYQQLAHEYPVQLPAKTSSFQRWARWLHDRGPAVFAHELDYWVSRFERVQPLPQDKANGVPTWASVRAVSAELTVEETQALLQQAPAAYATQINDLLLTALLQTIVEWTQEAVMLIELESHGRQPIANLGLDDDSEIDLSRTVGWFTSAFPVRLAYQPSDPGDLILSVKEQLRQVPHHGLGYGIWRYIQQRPELMPFPMPPICFNYLGQFKSPAANPAYNHPNGREALLRGTGMEGFASSDTFGDGTLSEFFKLNGSGQFWNLFDLELMVVTGQLRVIWLYSENVHHRDTVERLTQGFMTNLRHLITHCQQQARLQQAVVG